MSGDFPQKPLAALRRTGLAFALGAVGGVGGLGLRFLLQGSSDPFDAGWPLFLEAASLLIAFAVALLVGRGAATALGVYAGLVAYLFVAGESEYPAASMIALAIHGFVPAVVGSALAALSRRWRPVLRRATGGRRVEHDEAANRWNM